MARSMMGPMPPLARRICLLVVLAAAQASAGPPELAPPARCFRLIALFDEIIVNRLDHRLLQIEARALAEARRRRQEAEAYCTTGRYWFGINAIEDALERIGVSPGLGAEPTPRGDG